MGDAGISFGSSDGLSRVEPQRDGTPLPPDVAKLFEVRAGKLKGQLPKTIENAKPKKEGKA